jgi:hypothetical protein
MLSGPGTPFGGHSSSKAVTELQALTAKAIVAKSTLRRRRAFFMDLSPVEF